jgi:hypothetical protein
MQKNSHRSLCDIVFRRNAWFRMLAIVLFIFPRTNYCFYKYVLENAEAGDQSGTANVADASHGMHLCRGFVLHGHLHVVTHLSAVDLLGIAVQRTQLLRALFLRRQLFVKCY